MIATVRGEVLVRRTDHVVLEAAGVGYRLAVSAETLRAVPAAGETCFLHSVTMLREDSIQLYGFASEDERDLFGMLITVSGIGPKVAMAALSGGPHRELVRAILAGDAKRFQAVPGIGKRTAERIILELKDRVSDVPGTESPGRPVPNGARALARDGLVGLGYQPLEAEQLLDAIAAAGGEHPDDPQGLITAALRLAAREG